MTSYLLPTDSKFVDEIAQSIARDRLRRESISLLESMTGITVELSESLFQTFDRVFDRLWAGSGDADIRQRAAYTADAIAAISAINLKLLTTPT